MLGMKVKVFTANLRDHKRENGREGVVVGIRHPFRFSPQDASLSSEVTVRLSEWTTITLPEGCVTPTKG
jgi:hypothetical protein